MPKCNECRATAVKVPIIELPAVKASGEVLDRPITLIGQPLCPLHCNSFVIANWITSADWKHYQEEARERGFVIPDQSLLVIQFKPIGWKPGNVIEVVKE